MQFQLVKNHRYWWPVNVRIPDPETAGKIIEQTLKIEFEAEDRDVSAARASRYRELTDPKDILNHEVKLMTEVCKNWDDVIDPQKAPVPFTEDNFASALNQEWFRNAVFLAYGESLAGEEARLGN
jgi:hypothetical protein